MPPRFNNLIESRARKQRSPAGTALSVLVHAGLISAAVYATAHATVMAEKPKEEKVTLVEMKKNDPPPPKEPPPPPPKAVAVAPVAKGFQVLTPPIKIPDIIPKVDLSKRVTDASDFSGKGVAGGRANGDANIKTAPISDNQTYFEFQVEKQAAVVPGNPSPQYPEALRATGGGDGKVQVQFVVDTTGRADMSTWKVLESSNDLFSQAAKDGVRKSRYYPAEIGGKKVKQLVQQAFSFSLSK